MNKLIPIEFKNQRIMTTKVLADEFGTDEGNIQKNFSRNEKRFVEGKHYYKLDGQALKDFKSSLPTECLQPIKFAPILYLWTDRGAARHAKILDTDEAWEVYEELEETYFKIKTNNTSVANTLEKALADPDFLIQIATNLKVERQKRLEAENKIQIMKPKADFYDDVAGSKDAIEVGSVAKILGIKGLGRNKLFELLRKEHVLQENNIPYQKFVDRGYFRTIEQKYIVPNGETKINIKTLVFQSGVDFIRKVVKGVI